MKGPCSVRLTVFKKVTQGGRQKSFYGGITISGPNIFAVEGVNLTPIQKILVGTRHLLTFPEEQVIRETKLAKSDIEFLEFLSNKPDPTETDAKKARGLLKRCNPFFDPDEMDTILNTSFRKSEEGKEDDGDAVKILSEHFKEFFLDQYENPMVLTLENEVLAIEDKKFQTTLQKYYYNEKGEILHSWNIADIIGIFVMKAHEGKKYNLSVRVTGDSNEIFIDPGNRSFNVVRISPGKIEVLAPQKPMFRRYKGSLPMEIDFSGTEKDVRDFFSKWSFEGEKDQLLFQVSSASSLIPNKPNVIKTVSGDNGAGKSNLTRNDKKIFDPSVIESISLKTGKEDDFKQTLSHNHIVNIDNLTVMLTDEQADIICRAASGDTISKRALYTNDEDFFLKYQRMVIINGINKPSDRGDFSERDIHFKLVRPLKERRETEEQLSKALDAMLPKVRGALMVAVSRAMEIRDSVYSELKGKLPRMADFTVWGEAISRSLGYGENEFYNAYMEKMDESNLDVISGNTVSTLLIKFLENMGSWEGTSSRLYTALSAMASQEGLRFPKSAVRLIRDIHDLRATLENIGIKFDDLKDGQRTKRITRIKTGNLPSVASVPSLTAMMRCLEADGKKIVTVNGIVSPILTTDGKLLASGLPSGEISREMAGIDGTDGKDGNLPKNKENEEITESKPEDTPPHSHQSMQSLQPIPSEAGNSGTDRIGTEGGDGMDGESSKNSLAPVECSSQKETENQYIEQDTFINTKGDYCTILEECSIYRNGKQKPLKKGYVYFLYHKDIAHLVQNGAVKLACPHGQAWDPVSRECVQYSPLITGVSSAVGSNVQEDGRSGGKGGELE